MPPLAAVFVIASVSVPEPASIVSVASNVSWLAEIVTPWLSGSVTLPTYASSVAEESDCAEGVTTVVVVVVVAVVVVVVDDPPQAARERAIIEMPPAFAAFLAFFDSQALTSLLVAFIMIGYKKYINTSGLNGTSLRLKQNRNKKLNKGKIKMNVNNYLLAIFYLSQNLFDSKI
jgi:hypothetical protein